MFREQQDQFYRREGDTWIVEIRIARLEQLFHSLDPSPFWQRDLDPAAAAYILESVQELPKRAPIRLLIHVASDSAQQTQTLVADTIHSYFRYRAKVNRQRLRNELERGRISLLVGLVFLTSCVLIGSYLEGLSLTGGSVLKEGFLIMGWVAMWRPLQIFLYDWWPHLGRARLYERVAELPVDVLPMQEPPAR